MNGPDEAVAAFTQVKQSLIEKLETCKPGTELNEGFHKVFDRLTEGYDQETVKECTQPRSVVEKIGCLFWNLPDFDDDY